MQTNQAGLDLIKSFEGCKLQSYQDVVGIWTIGYGHTGPEVVDGLSWTQDQADSCLATDLGKFENGVSSCVTAAITSNQFSALVCFSYNVGLGNLESSTLLKKLNSGDIAGAATEFLRWNKAGGNVVDGLTRRRQAESTLFSTPDGSSAAASSSDVLPAGPTDAEITSQLESVQNS